MKIRDRIKRLDRVKASELLPNPRNWRTHPQAQQDALRGVLAEVGWVDALLVRETPAGLQIVDGHMRAETTPDEEVPVLVLDLDDAEADKVLATFDPIAGMAESDPLKLDALLREIDTGSEALQQMLADLAEEAGLYHQDKPNTDVDAEPQIDKAEELRVKWGVEKGQLWLLGEHRLLCGDSTKAEDVERVMRGERINVAFTSPPYASQRKYDESSGFKPIHPDEYVDWWGNVQNEVKSHLAQDGSFFVNIKEAADEGRKQDYVKRLLLKSIDNWQWIWIEEYCWPRPALPLDPNTSRRFKNAWESVFHFALSTEFAFFPDEVRHESDGCFKYKDQKKAGKKICDGGQGLGGGAMSPVGQHTGLAYPSNVLPNFGGAKVVGHSAAFPVGLPAFFIIGFSQSRNVVYDPFSGSGTTLIACEQLNRRCRAIEISPAYVAVALQRYQDATGKTPTLAK